MDIDLLSKMVKELILDNDRVVLPGLGSFVAEIVPSTFSDKGYTINPPYRKLYFRAKPDEGNALADFYASSNGVQIDVAERIIADFVSELKSVLFERKTVLFPGLGRLRATKENTVFFVADEDLDIYPEGFALEPVSMKTHVETKEEVKAALDDLKSIVSQPMEVVDIVEIVQQPQQEQLQEEGPVEPLAQQQVDPVPQAEPIPIPQAEPTVVEVTEFVAVEEKVEGKVEEKVEEKPKPKVKKGPTLQEIIQQEEAQRKRMLKAVAYGALILIVSAFLLFILIARIFPSSFDNILYTPEELEIINRK